MIELNNEDFQTFVNDANVPVLVDFWAPWCAPCKAINPHLEKLSAEFDKRLHVVKVNVDEANEIAASVHVMSIPALLIFKNGKEVNRTVGSQSYERLKAFVEGVLSV